MKIRIKTGLYGYKVHSADLKKNEKEEIVIRGKYEVDGETAYKWVRKKGFNKKIYEDEVGVHFIFSKNNMFAEWSLTSDMGGRIKVKKIKILKKFIKKYMKKH